MNNLPPPKQVIAEITGYINAQSEDEIDENHFFFSALVEKKDCYQALKHDKFLPGNTPYEGRDEDWEAFDVECIGITNASIDMIKRFKTTRTSPRKLPSTKRKQKSAPKELPDNIIVFHMSKRTGVEEHEIPGNHFKEMYTGNQSVVHV